MPIVDLETYRKQLSELNVLPFRGSVVRVAGLTVESKGPPVGVGQLCEIRLADGRRVQAEVVGFQHSNRVLLPLESIDGIAPHDAVVARMQPRFVTVGDGLLGRVLDGLGRPIDGRGPLTGRKRPIENDAPAPMCRKPITRALPLGIRSIDGLITVGRGQRVGIFAGSGVGKSMLLGEIARDSDADVNVVALVGERGREVREFIEQALGPEGLARSVVCVATSDTSPIQRMKIAFMATAIAEHFRDEGRDVLFMMDSLTRFAHAQREIGLAAGEPPTTKGYCPSVFSLLPKLTERLGCAERGSITGIYTILVEGDDLSDPVADSVRSLLDGHIVLSRRLAEMGHYPAVDVPASVSRLMKSITCGEQQEAARRMRAIIATHREAEDLINIGAYARGSNPRIDKAIDLIGAVNHFLIQPIGERSSLAETVSRMKELTASWEFELSRAKSADEAA